jgi:hypothetical protein
MRAINVLVRVVAYSVDTRTLSRVARKGILPSP